MLKRSFLGIILILLGLGFLLDQFQIISFNIAFATYWPSILIFLGLVGLFDKSSSKFGNLILLILGILIQIDKLDLVAINIYKLFFPIILIIGGLRIIIPGRPIKFQSYVDIRSYDNENDFKKNDKFKLSKNIIDELAIISNIKTKNLSQEFQGGRATTILGEIVLDLKGAKLKDNYAEIDIITILGNVNILVPDDWIIEVRGKPLLGSIHNKAEHSSNDDAPLLVVRGNTIMGDIKII